MRTEPRSNDVSSITHESYTSVLLCILLTAMTYCLAFFMNLCNQPSFFEDRVSQTFRDSLDYSRNNIPLVVLTKTKQTIYDFSVLDIKAVQRQTHQTEIRDKNRIMNDWDQWLFVAEEIFYLRRGINLLN